MAEEMENGEIPRFTQKGISPTLNSYLGLKPVAFPRGISPRPLKHLVFVLSLLHVEGLSLPFEIT